MASNPIWEYFAKLESECSKAECKDCKKQLSLGSDKPGKQTVHGLKYHLEKCNKELFCQYKRKLDERDLKVPSAKKVNIGSREEIPKLMQPTLINLEEKVV